MDQANHRRAVAPSPHRAPGSGLRFLPGRFASLRCPPPSGGPAQGPGPGSHRLSLLLSNFSWSPLPPRFANSLSLSFRSRKLSPPRSFRAIFPPSTSLLSLASFPHELNWGCPQLPDCGAGFRIRPRPGTPRLARQRAAGAPGQATASLDADSGSDRWSPGRRRAKPGRDALSWVLLTWCTKCGQTSLKMPTRWGLPSLLGPTDPQRSKTQENKNNKPRPLPILHSICSYTVPFLSLALHLDPLVTDFTKFTKSTKK